MSKLEKDEIKKMFRGYKRVTGAMIRKLENYGLVISRVGKHYKVQRGDNIGGCVILARTPSDYRSGLNISLYLIKLIET